MSRYIDADKVLKELHLNHKDVIYIDKNDTAKRIKKIQGIDIVRCRECKWASPNKEGDYDCKCHIPIFRVDAEGYCYLADRKESE